MRKKDVFKRNKAKSISLFLTQLVPISLHRTLSLYIYISDCIFSSLCICFPLFVLIFVSNSIFPSLYLSRAHFISLSLSHSLSLCIYLSSHPSIFVSIAIHIYFIRIYSNYCSYLDFLISIYSCLNLFLFNSVYAHHMLLSICKTAILSPPAWTIVLLNNQRLV